MGNWDRKQVTNTHVKCRPGDQIVGFRIVVIGHGDDGQDGVYATGHEVAGCSIETDDDEDDILLPRWKVERV